MDAISSFSANSSNSNIQNEDLQGLMTFWNVLSQDDKEEYLSIKKSFHNGQQIQKNFIITSKDQRSPNFYNELVTALDYIKRDRIHIEERSIICGVAFAGPYICVNTRQLKNFIGRCKSSINGSFQQMGYSAFRKKAKAKNVITTIIKQLKSEPAILRQWTVRGASEKAQVCFISSIPTNLLPDINNNDLQIDENAEKDSKVLPANKKVNKIIPENLPFSPTSILNELKKVSNSNFSSAASLFSLNLSSASAVINSFFTNKKMNDSRSAECLSSFDDNEWNLTPKTLSDGEYSDSSFWEMPLAFQTSDNNSSSFSIADHFLKSSVQCPF